MRAALSFLGDLFLSSYYVTFFFWMRQIEWFGDGQCSCSLSPLSLCFSFPFEPQRLHLSSESLSSDKASTSLLYLHPPSFSLSLSSFWHSLHPYVQPSLALNEMSAEPVLWLAGIELDWAHALCLSLSHTHTHTRTLTHSRSRKQTDSVSPTAPCQTGTRTCMHCRAHAHRRTNTLSVIVNLCGFNLGMRWCFGTGNTELWAIPNVGPKGGIKPRGQQVKRTHTYLCHN